MSGHRQAALSLFALADGDQRRILAELPEADQRLLRTYLKELAALGFAPEASPSSAPLALQSPAAPVAATARARLMQADAAALLAVLENEPATLIAQLLSLESWPWAASLLDLLPAPRRALVRDALDGGHATAPARAAFLLDAVAAALAEQRPAPAPAAHGMSATLKRWMPWTR